MKCCRCDYYKTGYLYNACALTESECFMPQDNCTLVNDDNSINFEDEYFKGSNEPPQMIKGEQEAHDGQT